MYQIDQLKKSVVDLAREAISFDVDIRNIVYPPDPNMGDLSLPCFELSKTIGKAPAMIAQDIVSAISAKELLSSSPFVSVKAVGPYVNFSIDAEKLAAGLLPEIVRSGDDYGCSQIGGKKRVMVEYSNANTHKEIHVGHLRNICYGDAVHRLLAANGYDSIPVYYINDFGIHVAKTLWCYLEFYQGKEDEYPSKGAMLGEIYARASKELEENQLAKNMVGLMMKNIESRQGPEYELWQKTRQWSIDQFHAMHKEMGIEFQQRFFESEFIEDGWRMTEKLKAEGRLAISDGALIANLEDFGLGVLMFLRSDGTALYPVADLSLAVNKFERFKLDKSIYVVDIRQSLYFKQLFKVLEQMGYQQEMIHLGYDFVKSPDGMFSSRTGNVITYETLRDKLLEYVVAETRSRHSDWSDEKIADVAKVLMFGAIKFEMIKVSADKIITFDMREAMRFDGFTSAYVQYAYARIKSIIRKSDFAASDVIVDLAAGQLEKTLLLKLSKYPEIVARAAEHYEPSDLAKYLYELASCFNDFYHQAPVLNAEETVKNSRLAIISAVSQILKTGLSLLGIGVVEEM